MLPTPPGHPHRATLLPRCAAVLLLTVWALYQCFWKLADQNIGGDEYIYVSAGWEYVHGVFDANREHPPMSKYLFGLAQVLFGEGVVAPRALVGLMVIGGAVIMFTWLRRDVGWWAGYSAAFLWLLLPRSGAGARIDRVALLDPVMMFFAIAAMFTAWRWTQTRQRWLLPLSAALMAFSVTSKVTTAILVPALLLLVALSTRHWRTLVVSCLTWTLTFAAIVIALYAPMGIGSAVGYMIEFQARHNATGHVVELAGHVYHVAPWWANFHFLWIGASALPLVVLAVGMVSALALRPDRLVAYLGSGLCLLVGFNVLVAKVALASYYYAWLPLAVLLASTGLGRLATVGTRFRLAPALVVVLTALAVIPSWQLSQRISQLHPTGPALLPSLLADEDIPEGRLLFVSYPPGGAVPYIGQRGTMDLSQGPFAAIVVGRDPRFPVPEEIRALLETRSKDFKIHRLDDLTVFVPKAPIVETDSGLAPR